MCSVTVLQLIDDVTVWTNQNWSYISMPVIPWQKISCGLKSKHPKFFFCEVVWNDDKSTMSSNNEASCQLSCDLSCARLDGGCFKFEKKINLSRFQLIRFEAKAAFVRRSENWKVVGLNPSRWCAFYSSLSFLSDFPSLSPSRRLIPTYYVISYSMSSLAAWRKGV